jgi:hypothetical protein
MQSSIIFQLLVILAVCAVLFTPGTIPFLIKLQEVIMKKKIYILQCFRILMTTVYCSTKSKAQSYDIYVPDKKTGLTKQVASIPGGASLR